MTKAYFKDGNAEAALDFFEREIHARVERRLDQEEHLVKLFDATFGLDSQAAPSVDLQTFKDKYLHTLLFREHVKKELKAVHHLQQVLHNCDEEETNNVFLLQIVLREER